MIDWGRWLVRFVLIVLIGLGERVIGLPIMTVLLVSLFASRLGKWWRYGLLLAVSFLIATLFMISFSKVFLVVGGSYIWLRYGHQLIASKVIRLISGGLIGSIILVANLNDLRLSQLLYAVLVILISLLWLKRHKFHFV